MSLSMKIVMHDLETRLLQTRRFRLHGEAEALTELWTILLNRSADQITGRRACWPRAAEIGRRRSMAMHPMRQIIFGFASLALQVSPPPTFAVLLGARCSTRSPGGPLTSSLAHVTNARPSVSTSRAGTSSHVVLMPRRR